MKKCVHPIPVCKRALCVCLFLKVLSEFVTVCTQTRHRLRIGHFFLAGAWSVSTALLWKIPGACQPQAVHGRSAPAEDKVSPWASAGSLIAIGAKQVRKHDKWLVSNIIEINIVGTATTRETDLVWASCSSIIVYVYTHKWGRGPTHIHSFGIVELTRTDVCF